MALVHYNDIIRDAEVRGYALGYFEAWDIQSVLAIIRAAEDVRSPVMIGFSGVYMPAVCNDDKRWLAVYGSAGRRVAEKAGVPVAFIFNESPYLDWVYESMNCGFNVVMYTDESLSRDELIDRVSSLVRDAHKRGIAVEAEVGEPLGSPHAKGVSKSLTDPGEAAVFAEKTGIDALGVLVGNRHMKGEEKLKLDIDHVRRLKDSIMVPLVLHAGSGVDDDSLRESIKAGIRRVNIGSAIKRPAFISIRSKIIGKEESYPGYIVLGSGAEADLLGGVGSAIYDVVVQKLKVFGSAGKA